MLVQFSGGLQSLFNDREEIQVDVPPGADLLWLLGHLRGKVDGDESLFLQEGHVRPGILVLVNDTDWELLDEESYVIQPNDKIHFASTLHGG